MLREHRAYLESKGSYAVHHCVAMVTMPVSLLAASAGLGDSLDDENFEIKEFPASAVPDGAQFAVPVDGDSKAPLYKHGQPVWVQQCTDLTMVDVGLFVVDGHGYIKTYDEQKPDEDDLEDCLLHPQIVPISRNDAYKPKGITASIDFRVVGRVHN